MVKSCPPGNDSSILPRSRMVFSAFWLAHSIITRRVSSGAGNSFRFGSVAECGADDGSDDDGGGESYRDSHTASMPRKRSPFPIPCAASNKKFRHSCVSMASPVLRSASADGIKDSLYSELTAPSSRVGIPGWSCKMSGDGTDGGSLSRDAKRNLTAVKKGR